MRAGRESRNYSKYCETRRKATRGACYRWHYVVGNASVSVFMYTGQRRHVRSTSAIIRPQPRSFVDPLLWTPISLACLLAGVTLNTTASTPTRTGLSRRPRYCGGVCVSVWFRDGGCAFCLSPPSLLRASSSSTACLLPLLVLPVGTLGSAHPRSHHSVV